MAHELAATPSWVCTNGCALVHLQATYIVELQATYIVEELCQSCGTLKVACCEHSSSICVYIREGGTSCMELDVVLAVAGASCSSCAGLVGPVSEVSR